MTATVILYGQRERDKAHAWVNAALNLSRITFAGPKRTIPQNAKFHAMVTELAEQLLYHGLKLSVDDWKLIALASLKTEMRIVPTFNNDGFVNLGRKTSRLSKEDFGFLIDVVTVYGHEHRVVFGGERDAAEG